MITAQYNHTLARKLYLKMSKLVYAVSTISLMLILVFATPHAYADDDENQPVPVMPPANMKFPGYQPVNTTGAIIPPGAAPGAAPISAIPTTPIERGMKALCTIPGGRPGGIASVSGGQLIGDWETGNLWFYNTATHSCTLIEKSPLPSIGYWGLAVTGSLVVLSRWYQPAAWWYCHYSSKTHTCTFWKWLYIPPTAPFCAAMPAGHCNPDGIAFDKSKNLYYVDVVNGVEVELTAATQYAWFQVVRWYSTKVIGIVIDSAGNHWGC